MLTYNVHRKFSGYPIGNVAAYIFGSCTFVCFVVALSCYFDFIGAVFIKMYTENIEAAVKFHSQFADSNSLLLANSIANKIDTDELREETLAEISKSIVIHRRKVTD